MRIEIYEAKNKTQKRKIIYIGIVVLVILLSVVLAITLVNYLTPKEQFAKGNSVDNQEIIKNSNSTVYLPKLTAKGKENINKIYHTDEKIVYLTFDDGPSNNVTPLILDLLKENNITATFFVLGSQVKKYPNIVKRIYEEGHYVANHGYSHMYKKIYENKEKVLEEYQKTENLIQKAIGVAEYQCHLFRFPGGSVGGPYDDVKKQAISLLDENEITYLDWNALSKDGEGNFTKEQLLENVKKTVKKKNAVVLLFHDAAAKILTYEILQDVINYLKEEGYQFGNMRNIIV